MGEEADGDVAVRLQVAVDERPPPRGTASRTLQVVQQALRSPSEEEEGVNSPNPGATEPLATPGSTPNDGTSPSSPLRSSFAFAMPRQRDHARGNASSPSASSSTPSHCKEVDTSRHGNHGAVASDSESPSRGGAVVASVDSSHDTATSSAAAAAADDTITTDEGAGSDGRVPGGDPDTQEARLQHEQRESPTSASASAAQQTAAPRGETPAGSDEERSPRVHGVDNSTRHGGTRGNKSSGAVESDAADTNSVSSFESSGSETSSQGYSVPSGDEGEEGETWAESAEAWMRTIEDLVAGALAGVGIEPSGSQSDEEGSDNGGDGDDDGDGGYSSAGDGGSDGDNMHGSSPSGAESDGAGASAVVPHGGHKSKMRQQRRTRKRRKKRKKKGEKAARVAWMSPRHNAGARSRQPAHEEEDDNDFFSDRVRQWLCSCACLHSILVHLCSCVRVCCALMCVRGCSCIPSRLRLRAQSLLEFGVRLGLDPRTDGDLLWIAEEAIVAPLPGGGHVCRRTGMLRSEALSSPPHCFLACGIRWLALRFH